MTDLRPGQQRLLRVFEGENADCVFIPHDPFDMRICAALQERGILQVYTEPDEGWSGYELTPAGQAAVQPQGGKHA